MPADTYTSILGLILQGTGNNDNTWGENLNQFVIQYVEDAIAGRSAITVNTSDVTLSAAQARSAILECTGTLTGNRNLIVPNASKKWTIRNGTSGSYTLGIKTASGSAVEIPQGGWVTAWCDGNDVVYVSPATNRHLAQSDGTAALPYYAFASDPDSGLYRIGANNLGIAVNGTKIVDVDADGIGITGDADVSGDASVGGSLAVSGLVTQGGAAIVPIGATLEYDGIQAPPGWLFKYGQAVSRTTYSALFDVLTITATATRNGTTTLSSVSTDFRDYGLVGAYIEGTGITTGTTITAVTATTITLSQAAAGSGSITIRILPHGQGDGSTTFNIPDDRDYVKAGRGNMGGTSVNRLTGLSGGVAGDKLGSVGGSQSHTLSVSEMPSHDHGGETGNPTTNPASADSSGTDSILNGTGGADIGANSFTPKSLPNHVHTIPPQGGGGAHNNVQPTRITNYIIFTGVY